MRSSTKQREVSNIAIAKNGNKYYKFVEACCGGHEYLNQGGWPFHFFLHGGFFQIPICVLLFIVEHGFIVSQLERWNFPKRCTNPSYHLLPLKLQHTQPPFQVYFWSMCFIRSFQWSPLNTHRFLACLDIVACTFPYFGIVIICSWFHWKVKLTFEHTPFPIFVHSEPESQYNPDS